MAKPLTIEMVSDIVCPWCVIGLLSLERALAELEGEIAPELGVRPFELNPNLGTGGEDIGPYLAQKYGAGPERVAEMHETVRARAAELGYTMGERPRIYNTFGAHRALHWAKLEGRQMALKRALFDAYFQRGEDPSDPDTVAVASRCAGLDPDHARDVVAGGQYGPEVRAEMALNQGIGIQAVPTFIIAGKYAIQGGQPPEVFVQALREIASL